MREQMEKRPSELQTELKAGQKILVHLECREANIRETLLRISGAIQMLEELLSQKEESTTPADSQPKT